MGATDPAEHVPAVAAFDLDGTLTEGGSVIKWLCAVAGRPTVRSSVIRHAPSLLAGALRSGTAADEAKEALFGAVLAGRPAELVASVSAQFAAEHLRSRIRPAVAARLVAHLDAGHAVVVVSASPSLYVALIAEALGASGAAATELEVDAAGSLTGRYRGSNCRGEEKLRRVRGLLADIGTPPVPGVRPLYAYGNSRGDLRLLEAAQFPVDVSRLGRLGRLGRFPRLGEVAV